MKLFDLRRAAAVNLERSPRKDASGRLAVDDLLSRGSEALGFEVDAEGKLLLIEGSDFD